MNIIAWIFKKLHEAINIGEDSDYLIDVYGLARMKKYKEAAIAYKSHISKDPTRQTNYVAASRITKLDDVSEKFYNAVIDIIENQDLKNMFYEINNAPSLYKPGKFWIYYMFWNALQIECSGIENFKRTVNNNYFNWTSDNDLNIQYESVQAELGINATKIDKLMKNITFNNKNKPNWFSDTKWLKYNQYLAMLWFYTLKKDKYDLSGKWFESKFGNPDGIEIDGRLITQDLCNTILEANTFLSPIGGLDMGNIRVGELGAGHGRIQALLLKVLDNVKITIIDIPPALYVSQWYLTKVYTNMKTFTFRNFSSYEEIKADIDDARMVFLEPNQVELLPDKYFDLFINVSSLQEMRQDQINNWFKQINRLTSKWFYYKEYLRSVNGFDDEIIFKGNYPKFEKWEMIFDHINPIHRQFFEIMMKIQ